MTILKKEHVLQQTKLWIENFVIGLNICPFSARSYNEDAISYTVQFGDDDQDLLNAFGSILLQMNDDKEDQISNAFFILPNFSELDDLLDLTEDLNGLLEDHSLESTFQLVSFHPYYIFDGAESTDPANKRNQSPFPMIHILRSEEVERAIEEFGDTQKIVVRNIELLRSQN